MKRNVKTNLTKEQVKKLIRDLPGILSGRLPSQFGLHKIFWGAVAYSLFQSISEAYQEKSKGGTDDLGNSWDDLSQHTKAYQRDPFQNTPSMSLSRRAKRNKKTGLGLLTPTQHKTWKNIFGHVYHSNLERLGEEEAKKLAGQLAWSRLKEMGAVTKWDVFGTRDLLILQDKGTLSSSLLPGKFDPASGYKKGNKNQVFTLRRGSIEMGSSVPYAEMHNKTRPIWPEEMGPWLEQATEFGRDAVYDRLVQIFS